MVDAYIYQADIYCAECGRAIEIRCENDPTARTADRGDSDNWPQGPYPYGGGEADSPQHCAACSEFLENALTAAGYQYVAEAIDMRAHHGDGAKPVLRQWAGFYGGENSAVENAIQEWQVLRPQDWLD